MISERDAGNLCHHGPARPPIWSRKSYVKDIDPRASWSNTPSAGCISNINEKIPSALKERLDKVKDMKDADLLKLLTEARQQLGKREDLAKGKDITYSLHRC